MGLENGSSSMRRQGAKLVLEAAGKLWRQPIADISTNRADAHHSTFSFLIKRAELSGSRLNLHDQKGLTANSLWRRTCDQQISASIGNCRPPSSILQHADTSSVPQDFQLGSWGSGSAPSWSVWTNGSSRVNAPAPLALGSTSNDVYKLKNHVLGDSTDASEHIGVNPANSGCVSHALPGFSAAEPMLLDSVKRKRRKKMNKHKERKRRRRDKSKR